MLAYSILFYRIVGGNNMIRIFRLIMVLPLLALFLAAAPQKAYACSCMMPGSPQEEMDRSAAVFAGKVIKMEAPTGPIISSADPVAVLFEVSEVWKGPQEAQIRLTTARDSASCGYEFQGGGEYLVYAYEGEFGLEAGLCTRTMPVANANQDFAELGEGFVPEPASPESESQPEWLWALVGGGFLLGLVLLGIAFLPRRKKSK
jgi:hypothetical protein